MYKSRFLNFLVHLYTPLISIGSFFKSLFLCYMRITWGYEFFLIGLGKFHDMPKTVDMFISLNIPHPHFYAPLVATVETCCGLLLFLGLASRLVAIPLIATMLVALNTFHAAHLSHFRFFFEPMSLVKEAPYPFLVTSLLVFFFGPGKLSIDALLKRWVERQPRW